MDMKLVSFALLFGALVLLSGAVPSSGSPSFFGNFMNLFKFKISRGQCISRVAKFLGRVDISDQVSARLEMAREYYYKDVEPGYGVSQSISTPDYCMPLMSSFSKNMEATYCLQDPSIVGRNELQNVVDVIKASEEAKRVIEAKYACAYEREAGKMLRKVGLFDAIVSIRT